MQAILTVEQIQNILNGCEQSLRMLQATPEFRALQSSRYFSTSNDLVLADAIQTLVEVSDGIANVQALESGFFDDQIAKSKLNQQLELKDSQNV
ncbi:MAG: hypothetical protein FWK04_26245 [Nostoc sp. GBBB01]|nr:hypothetical protein [Nostoc sp. GBBB01]